MWKAQTLNEENIPPFRAMSKCMHGDTAPASFLSFELNSAIKMKALMLAVC